MPHHHFHHAPHHVVHVHHFHHYMHHSSGMHGSGWQGQRIDGMNYNQDWQMVNGQKYENATRHR